jgi:hypothetical protein
MRAETRARRQRQGGDPWPIKQNPDQGLSEWDVLEFACRIRITLDAMVASGEVSGAAANGMHHRFASMTATLLGRVRELKGGGVMGSSWYSQQTTALARMGRSIAEPTSRARVDEIERGQRRRRQQLEVDPMVGLGSGAQDDVEGTPVVVMELSEEDRIAGEKPSSAPSWWDDQAKLKRARQQAGVRGRRGPVPCPQCYASERDHAPGVWEAHQRAYEARRLREAAARSGGSMVERITQEHEAVQQARQRREGPQAASVEVEARLVMPEQQPQPERTDAPLGRRLPRVRAAPQAVSPNDPIRAGSHVVPGRKASEQTPAVDRCLGLRLVPGQWRAVGEYHNRNRAKAAVWYLRHHVAGRLPDGGAGYEFRHVECVVFGRFTPE